MKPPHTPAFRKSTSLGSGGGPLQGQRRDGADEKGADQVDGKRPDGKAPVPSQWNLPSQITVHGPQESPSPTAIQFSMDATLLFMSSVEIPPAAPMVTQPAAGGKSPPCSDRPAGFGRGHRARPGNRRLGVAQAVRFIYNRVTSAHRSAGAAIPPPRRAWARPGENRRPSPGRRKGRTRCKNMA